MQQLRDWWFNALEWSWEVDLISKRIKSSAYNFLGSLSNTQTESTTGEVYVDGKGCERFHRKEI